MNDCVNVHGTAIVIGTKGLLFIGPSGSGKSMLAFTCMAAARRMGAFAALISDDQVLVRRDGNQILGVRPDSIAGMIELRGSGIVKVASIPQAELHLCVQVFSLPKSERLPPENEVFEIDGVGRLPLIRLWQGFPDPLAAIGALVPSFLAEKPFRL